MTKNIIIIILFLLLVGFGLFGFTQKVATEREALVAEERQNELKECLRMAQSQATEAANLMAIVEKRIAALEAALAQCKSK